MTKKNALGDWITLVDDNEISSPQLESAPATIPSSGLAPNAPMACRIHVPDCENGPEVRDCVFFYDLQIAYAFYNYISRARFVVI